MHPAVDFDDVNRTVESAELRRVRFFAVAAALWGVAFVVLPADLQALWYLLFGTTCVVLVVKRARTLGGQLRLPIFLVGCAGASSLLSGVVREIHGALVGVTAPFPSPADLLVFASYGLFVAAILIVVRRRVPHMGPDPWLDAAVAGIAAAILQWTMVVIPYLQDDTLSGLEKNTNLIYSICSLSLVVAAALALVAGSVPSTSNRMLALGLIATFTADPVSLLVTTNRLPEAASIAVVALAIGFGCAGSIHPSVRRLTATPEDDLAHRLTRRRIVVLCLALFTPPLLLLRATLIGVTGIELVLPAVASVALTPLVLVRLGRLVRENERLATVEQTLRSVGERLVLVESTEDVARVISVGLEQLLGERFIDGCLLIDPLTSYDEYLPSDVRQSLRSLFTDSQFSSDLRTGYVHTIKTADGAHDTIWQAGPIVLHRHLRAIMVVSTNDGLGPVDRNAFSALCREASIALRAVEQTEQTVRERSEDRFGALIDNSSDIVTILDDELRLRYVSPVAGRLLGYPSDFREIGTALDLVHPDDLATAERMIADIRFGKRVPVEVRLRHLTGEFHWFEVVGVDLASDPNIRGIVLNAREIGDRKAAEERLQLSEARFKALVQHSSDVVLVIDPEEGVTYASPSVGATIGLEPDEILGRRLDEIFDDSGLDWERSLHAGTVPADHPDLLEFGFRNARGEWIHLEASVTDLRGEEAVGGFVLNARDVTERTTMMQRLRYQSTHDALTGLANRVLAAEELGGMLSRNAGASTVAVISLDIDDFKDINDSLGHGVGDRLLYAVAERIKESLSFGDVVARTGGDEFIVVLERAHGEAQVLELANQLLHSLERPFGVDDRELTLTASAGVAYDHDRETAAEVLLRNADTATYRAKQLGKRRAVVFETDMHTASFDRLELRADLARAIDTEQFVAHYQPIVSLATRRIVGCEALIRWQHPQRGLLSR